MFNGIWLVATEPLAVGGREVKAGERFHISRVHSGALLVTGRATIAKPQPPPKTRALEPEPVISTPQRRRRAPKAEAAPALEPPQSSTDAPAIEPESAPITQVIDPTDNEPLVIPDRRYHRRDLEAEE